MLDEPMNNTAPCGGGDFLSAASNASMSFSNACDLVADLSAAHDATADVVTSRAASANRIMERGMVGIVGLR